MLASISVAPDSANPGPLDDLQYITGNIDLLVDDDDILRLGQFAGALLLLPSIDVLADGVARMRSGQKTVEVILIGDTSSLWLIQKKIDGRTGLIAAHKGAETRPVLPEEFDAACERAIVEFFVWLCRARPRSTWDSSATQIANAVKSVWPKIAQATPTGR